MAIWQVPLATALNLAPLCFEAAQAWLSEDLNHSVDFGLSEGLKGRLRQLDKPWTWLLRP